MGEPATWTKRDKKSIKKKRLLVSFPPTSNKTHLEKTAQLQMLADLYIKGKIIHRAEPRVVEDHSWGAILCFNQGTDNLYWDGFQNCF